MTASELYELVKDLPREVWPDGLNFDENNLVWYTQRATSAIVGGEWVGVLTALEGLEHAAALFTANLVEVLLSNGMYTLYRPNIRDVGYSVTKVCDRTGKQLSFSDGPTLLHALIAAYKGASNG